QPRRLAATTADEIPGAWSPDGARIVYSSDEQGSHDLYTMASDGSDMQPLRAGTEENEITPDWWDEPETVEPTEPDCVTQPDGPGPLPSLTPLS
ncbi:MAG TPA: hypothetical protein VIG64_14555, partial [Actinomycetota bacterium]